MTIRVASAVFGMVVGVGLLAIPALAERERKFQDVPPMHWASDDVERLAARSVLRGYPDGSYQGRRAITRYEAAAAASRFRSLLPLLIEMDLSGRRVNSFSPFGPFGWQGPDGPPGKPGPEGAAGPTGPPGVRPPEFDELLREQQRQRADVSRLQGFFSGGASLPRLEVERIWGDLETLSQRLRRAEKPIPGILRGHHH